MPTIKNMIEKFIESEYRHGDSNILNLLLGKEEHSLIMQEEMTRFPEKNVIKTTDKKVLSQQVSEAIDASFLKIRTLKDKVDSKKAYKDLIRYLNENFGFNIILKELTKEVIGTPEERCLYILRQTEREYSGNDKKGLSQIATELGCSRRILEKDVKKMTEQGFKLLGVNIQLVEETDNILKLKSTPHPVILMQNVLQLMVLLEGLRTMEDIESYKNYARSTAVNIWNQLTEYAQNKILDAIEKLGDTQSSIEWYLDLRNDSNEHRRFINEFENCKGNISSQLMYISKNGKPFNLTCFDEKDEKMTIPNCVVHKYFISEAKTIIVADNNKIEVDVHKIIEIEIM